MTDLLHAWRVALPPAAPASAATRVGEDLVNRWSEPHRHYHTTRHLRHVLGIVDDYADQARDVDAVRLAAWFHDAIYDPRRVDNEEASALLAEAVLPELGITPDRVAEVARLVRLTAIHDPMAGDRNAALLTDADLAILAVEEEAYRAYTLAVRLEYAYVSEQDFAVGRSTVLNNLLSLPRLFHTPVLRERWEETARRNLTMELAELRPLNPAV